MVTIAQLVEQRFVVPCAMGSIPISYPKYGEMAEWLIASVLKTELPVRVTGVRTPLSPPK